MIGIVTFSNRQWVALYWLILIHFMVSLNTFSNRQWVVPEHKITPEDARVLIPSQTGNGSYFADGHIGIGSSVLIPSQTGNGSYNKEPFS